MLPSVKMKVLSFCQELSDHDPWYWKDICQKLLQNINYEAKSVLLLGKDFYEVTATLNDGRLVKLSNYYECGWAIEYESPAELKARQESGLTPRALDGAMPCKQCAHANECPGGFEDCRIFTPRQ